jgi:DnaJ homolog subfamily A member 5
VETIFEDIKRGASPLPRPRDRGLTVRHLAPFFDPSIWSGFEDEPNVCIFVSLNAPHHYYEFQSFFTIYRNLFGRLAHEEKQLSGTTFPSFGLSTWPWATASSEQESAKIFYNAWINFVTSKDFSWVDAWNTSEASDRRVRR